MKNNIRISIIGQTNVGKSTLFNKLCNRKISSLEHEGEDTTYDYVSCQIKILDADNNEQNGILIDNAGIKKISDFKNINCNYGLYVVDFTKGLNEKDLFFLRFLKTSEIKVILLVNKCDLKSEYDQNYFKKCGLENIIFVSATKGIGFENIYKITGIITPIERTLPLIALIGPCNSGKSTLFNAILNENRSIVSKKRGATKDSIIEECQTTTGAQYCFMDTAGFQKEILEIDYNISKQRKSALDLADGIIVVLDGIEGLTNTDKKILDIANKFGKFMIVCINKSDKLENEYVFKFMNKNEWVPLLKISAINKKIGNLFKTIDICYQSSKSNFKTSELNKLNFINLKSKTGQPIKIKYIVQVSQYPLVFKLFTNRKLSISALKFVRKQIAQKFNITGAHIYLNSIIDKENQEKHNRNRK